MGWGAAWGWGCLVGLGKCNSSLQPGVAAEREARGRKPPGSAVKVWGWGSHRADPGVWGSEAGSARRGLGEGADGGSPVWSPGRRPPARSLARCFTILCKAPKISVLSACGNVVWRKVAPRPRSCSSPSGSPTLLSRALPLSALRPRPPPPPFSDGARDCSPVQANLEQPPSPSGKKLGAFGTGGSIPFTVLEPRSCQGVWIPEGWPVLERPSRGHRENLPQCLERGLQLGRRLRPL